MRLSECCNILLATVEAAGDRFAAVDSPRIAAALPPPGAGTSGGCLAYQLLITKGGTASASFGWRSGGRDSDSRDPRRRRVFRPCPRRRAAAAAATAADADRDAMLPP